MKGRQRRGQATRVISVLMTVLALVGGVWQHSVLAAARRELAQPPFLQDAGLELYHTRQQCCGIVAAYAALRLVGRPVSLANAAENLPVSEDGTTMADLRRFLETSGVDVVAIEIDASGLLYLLRDTPDSCAVAWLEKDHWVAVVAGDASDFVYYEYPMWRRAGEREFAARFAGRALFVRREQAAKALQKSYWLRLTPLILFVANVAISLAVFSASLLQKRGRAPPDRTRKLQRSGNDLCSGAR